MMGTQTIHHVDGHPRVRELSRSVAHIDIVALVSVGSLMSILVLAARRAPRLVVAVLGIVSSLVALAVRLGQRSGVSDEEVHCALPGDGAIPMAQFITNHGITIRAPAHDIWPWIVQMGYHRGGWYTSYWLDKLVWHIDNPSVDRIVPELQHLAVGDVVPDGPPGTAYWKVAMMESDRALVYLDEYGVHVPGIAVSWAFVLNPIDGHTTRALVRTRGNAKRSIPMTLLAHLIIVPADFIMAGQVLRGVKHRVEQARQDRRDPGVDVREGGDDRDSPAGSGVATS